VTDFGLSFDCALTFAEILERLNQLGPWSWRERDSAWYGNIASARTGTVRLDLVETGANEIPGGSVDAGNGQPFAISVRASRDRPPDARAWSAVEKRVREVVLPALGATRVQPTDPID
jgi:hypothetical protein